MRYFQIFVFIVFAASCTREDPRFNFSFTNEVERTCFQDNFTTMNEDNIQLKKSLLDSQLHFYVKGKLVNNLQGINHDFFMMDGHGLCGFDMLQGLQYFSADPTLEPGTKPSSTFTEMLLGGTPSDKFAFALGIVFTPQEVATFNESFDKFFTKQKLDLYDSKSTNSDDFSSHIESRTGFDISFYIGCLKDYTIHNPYKTPSDTTYKVSSHRFWLPRDGNAPRIGKILSYERDDHRNFYTYKVTIDISGKLYLWGTKATSDTYFCDIIDGILYLKFDQAK